MRGTGDTIMSSWVLYTETSTTTKTEFLYAFLHLLAVFSKNLNIRSCKKLKLNKTMKKTKSVTSANLLRAPRVTVFVSSNLTLFSQFKKFILHKVIVICNYFEINSINRNIKLVLKN